MTLSCATHCPGSAAPYQPRPSEHREMISPASRRPRCSGRIRTSPKSSLLICPSGGLLTGVSSPFCKNISVFTYPKSHLQLFASHPTRGAYHDRHGRGEGCGGRGSVLRAMGSQGWSKDL